MNRRPWLIILVALVVILVVATQSGWLVDKTKTGTLPGMYSVARYTDGDTIDVNMNGRTETVRFIGVDTPETHKPNTPVQCFGPDAANYTKARISDQGGRVRLQADPEDTNRDRYGRLLRYVYLADGTLLDEDLIKTGYGFAYLGFPFEKAQQFAQDQAIAMNQKVGLWSACQPTRNEFGGYTSNAL